MFAPLFSVEDDQLVQFVIYGHPLPKERARAFQANGHIHFYNKSRNHELRFQDATKEVMGGLLHGKSTYFRSKFLEVSLLFSFRRPDYHFVGGNRASGILDNDVIAFPSHTDVDNLCKFVLDSLNGVMYNDDSRVVGLLVGKEWAWDPISPGSTSVKIRAVKPEYRFVL